MKSCRNCDARLYDGPRPYQIDEFVCRDCQRSPAVQVRVLLESARQRAMTFDEAWVFALGDLIKLSSGEPDFVNGRVRWPHDTTHRREWKRTLADSKARKVWRAAYRNDPAKPAEKTLRHLAIAA